MDESSFKKIFINPVLHKKYKYPNTTFRFKSFSKMKFCTADLKQSLSTLPSRCVVKEQPIIFLKFFHKSTVTSYSIFPKLIK